MMSHLLQAWHHTRCIRHRTHCIFVITTSPLISHPLLYDITPTICVTAYAHCITSHPLLMSSHFWHHNLYIWNHIQYVGQHIPYTWDITVTNLCHHTHCFDIITSTLGWHHPRHIYGKFFAIKDITSSIYDNTLPFFYITPTIFDIVSTVSL